MKALVYTANNTLEYEDVNDPTLVPGDVLVKVEAVGICGSDMHAYHGHDARRLPPLILGHEAAGEAVTGSLAGRKVTINPLMTPVEGKFARAGRPNLAPERKIISMADRQGAFAEYVAIPEGNIIALPDGFDIAKAALAEPLSVSWRAAKRACDLLIVPLDEARAVVLGGGAIGLGAALALRNFGIHNITIAETNPVRKMTLKNAGDFRVYSPIVNGEPDENSVDLVIDAVGAVATRAAACRMIAPGGVIVHIGLLPEDGGLDIRKITLQEVTLTGAYCYTPDDFRETVTAMIEGKLGSLDWFETRPLADGAMAFSDIDGGKISSAKIILKP
ncbi:alcohol dehydrogenase catalytic domain-containing protein [Brucella thiophenivorans]|uniref:Zinc-binding dehydrogenase family protein n=1 Tax=Brucella thiophenivorans TaxID=571255 RepID=A0A256G7R8_9HYPH|nr:alcohol dehydrogenase catalytic domain-containing protein [Brucella thiophenivorans]OYR22996.1 zinc-binding dehydrogenase family protein [Brucella thiophenivorans]